jgi:hypothetical protein
MSTIITYREFLTTDIWRRTAESVFCRAGGQCERCGTAEGPHHAHHITYYAPNRIDAPAWVRHGWLPDYPWIVCLCDSCHRYLHSMPLLPRFRETSRILRSRTPDRKRRLLVIEMPFSDFATENWILCRGQIV